MLFLINANNDNNNKENYCLCKINEYYNGN